jgi:hypothetical protein
MGNRSLAEDSNGDFVVFTVHHLTAAFVILILGHAVSWTVLMCELIRQRASK